MTFTSFLFLLFFLAVLLLTAICDKLFGKCGRNAFLLVASYVFYAACDYRFCLLLAGITLAAYAAGKYKGNRFAGLCGVIIPLCALAFFKYFNFFLSSLSALFGTDLGTFKIILPAGISFFCFQAISYSVDVHRGKLEGGTLAEVALYLSFFPVILSGPILRGGDFLPQLREDRHISSASLSRGVQIFVFGLFKKMVLADRIAIFVNEVFQAPITFSWDTILLAAIGYSLQIYFDFSGYSDMAIGCANCLGFDIKKNFDLPYLSQNVTEFWHRWHISLSTWLRDYLYIPLGGNRKGKFRQSVNQIITMLLGGLWHGANWTFVVWGGLNGLALVVDKLIRNNTKKKFAVRLLSIIGTFMFTTLMWTFFKADSISTAWTLICRVFTLSPGIVHHYFWVYAALVIMIAAYTVAVIRSKASSAPVPEGYYPIQNLSTYKGLTLFLVFVGLTFALCYTNAQPFVYFQF